MVFFDFLELTKEEEKSLEAVNIPKKLIKVSKRMKESKRAQKVLEVQVVQATQDA